MRNLTPIFAAIAMSLGTTSMAQTQQIDPNQAEQAPFASENAIIDTSIPFAIGAREAQQSLRGSFGWPTFQEGLVQGVYFRFDPDGYARFAPTPRLDTDVFEVICRPRTYSCMGRKGALSVILNSRGQMQLKIDDVQSGDRFFVSEGVSEIEIPERILQPLDTQLELLLSTGGDLIVRRGDNEKDRISLTGFMPVSAYLRWVTAKQDYSILPRGWPVPNAAGSDATVTQATSWQSPMPQPQNFPAANGLVQNQFQQTPQPLQVQVQPTIVTNNQTEVDEVKSELKVLRELLMERNQVVQAETQPPKQEFAPTQTTQNTAMSGSIAQLMPQNGNRQPVSDQIAALQQASAQIQADLLRLTRPNQLQPNTGLAQTTLNPPTQTAQTEPVPKTVVQDQSEDPALATAKRLQYLMAEIGLDAKTALMLIQLGEDKSVQTQNSQAEQVLPKTQKQQPLFQEDVVAQILKELESEAEGQQPTKPAMPVSNGQDISQEEFMLLSSYFKSVMSDR